MADDAVCYASGGGGAGSVSHFPIKAYFYGHWDTRTWESEKHWRYTGSVLQEIKKCCGVDTKLLSLSTGHIYLSEVVP